MSIDLTSSRRWHPDRWRPSDRRRDGIYDRPQVGQIVGWRYAAWAVTAVQVAAETDLSDDDRQRLLQYKPAARDKQFPYAIVLRHERGPILLADDEYTVQADAVTVRLDLPFAAFYEWNILNDRYPVCSCCGHPYPCQAYAADRVAEDEAERMALLLDSHAPGMCAACREPISSQQKTVTFPEPSVLVPGAPGPTYHAGRIDCASEARRYELAHRLPSYPNAARLASCPGLQFEHVDGRRECTAELLCAGHHGPGGRWAMDCRTCYVVGGGDGGYPRPPSACADEACLGRDHSLGAPDPYSVGDLFGTH